MAKTKSVTAQMNDILEEYNEEVQTKVDASAKSVAAMCARRLRMTSPKRPGGGEYAKSWGVVKQGPKHQRAYIVRNAKHYQLTHLLENGHAVVNKYGEFGRAPAIKHIGPVEQWGVAEFGNMARGVISGT